MVVVVCFESSAGRLLESRFHSIEPGAGRLGAKSALSLGLEPPAHKSAPASIVAHVGVGSRAGCTSMKLRNRLAILFASLSPRRAHNEVEPAAGGEIENAKSGGRTHVH